MISFGFIFLKNVVHQTVCLLLWNVSSFFRGSFIMKHFLLWNVSSFFFRELHHETFPIVKCKWVHFWATSSWNNSYFNWCWFGHAAIRGRTLMQMSHFLLVILLLYDYFVLFFFGTGNWEWNGQSRCQQLAASLRISLLMITPGVSMVKSLSKAPLIQGEQP